MFAVFLIAHMIYLVSFQILQAKVRRLEHLLHLKDIRIEELTKRVEQMGGKY